MILTTTPSVEGRSIAEYKGIVFGEVISGVDVIKDFTAGLSNFFGGRSATYEDELTSAREQALQELEQRAARLAPMRWWVSMWTMRCWVPTMEC